MSRKSAAYLLTSPHEPSMRGIAVTQLLAAGLVLALALFACEGGPAPASIGPGPLSAQPAPHAPSATSAPESPSPAEIYAQTLAEFERVGELVKLPGAPAFEANRALLVARAKAEPLFFIAAPQPDPGADAATQSLRLQFEQTDYPWRALKELKGRLSRRPEFARQLLLRDGYLYSDRPNHSFALVSLVRPDHLFTDEEIWVQRGEKLMRARRGEEGRYFFADGPEKDQRVRLLHLDRIGTGEVPKALHRDFRSLRYRLFFERAKVTHITEDYLIADLRYEEHWVPSLLKSDGPRLELVAELIPEEKRAQVAAAKRRLEAEARLVSKLREAMRAQIDEGLPFDEPKTEEGQQDGKLRALWRDAYLGGRNRYRFNGDSYPVFDELGHPVVPQVCIDFMVDTFERASGRWWRKKNDGERGLSTGRLDLSQYDREALRRTQYFREFAEQHPEWFEVVNFPRNSRVQLGYKDSFFQWLSENVDHFRAGDIVLIRGHTPWDEVEEHTHSFFVYDTDPMTGVPIAIAGNAGPANLWSWETEARRTPNRTVRTRIRPKVEWLQSFVDVDPNERLDAPPLVSGRK